MCSALNTVTPLFSAGDPLMRRCCSGRRDREYSDECSDLSTYVARSEARAAFKRAFAARLAVFIATSGLIDYLRQMLRRQLVGSA
jgi:hypothetical protein